MYLYFFFLCIADLGHFNSLVRFASLTIAILINSINNPIGKCVISDHGCKEHIKSNLKVILISVSGHFPAISCCIKFEFAYYVTTLFYSTGEHDQTPASP